MIPAMFHRVWRFLFVSTVEPTPAPVDPAAPVVVPEPEPVVPAPEPIPAPAAPPEVSPGETPYV